MIAEGSSKLASVPSGGSGGGAAAASGGAAAGGAAAAEEKAEEKEEGMLYSFQENAGHLLILYRKGRVRRGYGIRSLRLECQFTTVMDSCSRYAGIYGQGFWKGLCGLGLSFACHGNNGIGIYGLLMRMSIMQDR